MAKAPVYSTPEKRMAAYSIHNSMLRDIKSFKKQCASAEEMTLISLLEVESFLKKIQRTGTPIIKQTQMMYEFMSQSAQKAKVNERLFGAYLRPDDSKQGKNIKHLKEVLGLGKEKKAPPVKAEMRKVRQILLNLRSKKSETKSTKKGSGVREAKAVQTHKTHRHGR